MKLLLKIFYLECDRKARRSSSIRNKQVDPSKIPATEHEDKMDNQYFQF